MDLRNMSYILEVAKNGNITKVADSCHISQSNLSKIIKRYEDELGVVIFDRSGKNLTLTDMGKTIIPQVENILFAMDELYKNIEEVNDLKKGTVHIGLPPVISSEFIPHVIAPFRSSYPNIIFGIVEKGSKDIEKMVANGDLDLGVVLLPIAESKFNYVNYMKNGLRLAVHESNPLSAISNVNLSDLANEDFVCFTEGFAVREHIISACKLSGFEPNITYASAQWDVILELVASNMGIAFVPSTVAEKFVNKNVTFIDAYYPYIPWDIVVAWKKERYLSASVKTFLDYVNKNNKLKN